MSSIEHMINWAQKNDVVAININMNEKVGRIWNYSQNKSYKNNDKVIELGLPNEVGIVIYFGKVITKMTVIKQFIS